MDNGKIVIEYPKFKMYSVKTTGFPFKPALEFPSDIDFINAMKNIYTVFKEKDPTNAIVINPKGTKLYYLGTFDSETGEFQSNKKCLGCMSDYAIEDEIVSEGNYHGE